jgi:hypothetical protein
MMFGTDAPSNIIELGRNKSVGELVDWLRTVGPGGGTASALGGDLTSGVRGIQEELGIPAALSNYQRNAELLRNLPQDIISRTQGSMEPITESQRRALEASEREPLSEQLSSASDYLSLLNALATPRISALESEWSAKQQKAETPKTVQPEPYEFQTLGQKSAGYVFDPNTGTYRSVGGGGGTTTTGTKKDVGAEIQKSRGGGGLQPITTPTTQGGNRASFSRNLFGGLFDVAKALGIQASSAIPSASMGITTARNLLGLRG